MSSRNNNVVQVKERAEYLDCVKGVAILCITLLHFENGVIPVWLNVWIGLFMISTFYFTSGWVFGLKSRVESPKELWRKRLVQLGMPYLWFGVLILLFDLIWWGLGQMSAQEMGREVYKFVTLRGLGTLWFLPVLFLGELLFVWVKHSRRPWITGSVLFIATYIISYIYYVRWRPMLEGNINYQLIDSPVRPIVMGLAAWPVIGLGYGMSVWLDGRLRSTRKVISAVAGVVVLLVSIWFVIAPPFNFFYFNNLVSNVLPVAGFIGVFALLSGTWIGKFFSYWGRNSLILMATHFSITMELLMAFDLYVMHHENFTGWRTIVYFAVAVLLTYPVVTLFNNRLSFMLGKKRTDRHHV
ncbi:MAG: acyltransferase family protein [Muribaculaceae bacterium]|nr:acyltransferase family protein [Muribaculaceae bacterium]